MTLGSRPLSRAGSPGGPALNASFIAALRTRCRYIPTASVDDLRGVTAMFSNLDLRWNFCILDSPPRSLQDFESRVDRAIAHGRDHGVPWSLVACAEWVPAEPRGLRPTSNLCGLWADDLAPPRRPLPELAFHAATTVEAMAPFAALNNLCYGLANGPADTLYAGYALANDASAVIGMADDEAVTCAGALPLTNEIYVGGVATHPEQRRRGFGEAAVRHAIGETRARTGLTRSILFATAGLAAMYEQLGFTRGVELRTFGGS